MGGKGGGGGILKTEEKVSTTKLSIYIHEYVYTISMVSISPNARDGTSEISRDPNTKSHIVAKNDSSKHSRDSLRTHIYLYIRNNFIRAKYSSNKDIGMVFVYHCCITTPCLFLFGASSHPYIPFILKKYFFPFVSLLPSPIMYDFMMSLSANNT